MKIFAITVLLGFLIIQKTSAVTGYWQDNVKLKQWSKVNDLINSKVSEIQALAKKYPLPSWDKCVSSANEELRTISEKAHTEIWSCVDNATSQLQGENCAAAAVTRVSVRSGVTLKDAEKCLMKLH